MGTGKRVDVQREMAHRVCDELLSPGHLAIVGVPGSGKSFLINQAANLAKVKYREMGSMWSPCDLASSIKKMLGRGKSGSRPEIVLVRRFEQVLRLPQNERDELGRALYDVVQNRAVKLVFEMDRRVHEAMNGAECGDSDFTKLFHHEYMKPFNERELRGWLNIMRVNDDGKVAKWLLDRTGGFPRPTMSYLDAACCMGRVSVAALTRLVDDVGSSARTDEEDWLDRVVRFLKRHSCTAYLRQNYGASNWLELLAMGSTRLPYEVSRELRAYGLIGGRNQLLEVLARKLNAYGRSRVYEIVVNLQSMSIDIGENCSVNMSGVPEVFAFSVMAFNGVAEKPRDFVDRLSSMAAGADFPKEFSWCRKSVPVEKGPEVFRQIRDRLEKKMQEVCGQECRLVCRGNLGVNWRDYFKVKWRGRPESCKSETFPAEIFGAKAELLSL